MPNTNILTVAGDKTAQVINRNPKYLLKPSTNSSIKKNTVEKVYQITDEGMLKIVLHIDNDYPIYTYLPKGLKLTKVIPFDNSYKSFTVPVPNDYLTITNSYLYPLAVGSTTSIVKTYNASGAEGNITLNVVSESTNELYVSLASTNTIKGYYVFEFEGYIS